MFLTRFLRSYTPTSCSRVAFNNHPVRTEIVAETKAPFQYAVFFCFVLEKRHGPGVQTSKIHTGISVHTGRRACHLPPSATSSPLCICALYCIFRIFLHYICALHFSRHDTKPNKQLNFSFFISTVFYHLI